MHLKLKARQVFQCCWVNQIFAVCEEMLSRVTKAAGSDTIQMGSAYSNLVSENITHTDPWLWSAHIFMSSGEGFDSLRALRRPADLWPKRARFSIRRMLFQTNTPAGDCFWWAQSSVFMHMQRVTHLRSFRCVFIIDTCSAEGLWCSIFVICAHIILIHTLTPLEPACFVHQKLAL